MFELKIQKDYFKAFLEKDISEGIIRLNQSVVFTLNVHEVYKIRIKTQDYFPVNALF